MSIKLTAELVQSVMFCGRVKVMESPAVPDSEHIEGLKKFIENSRFTHNLEEETKAYGLTLRSAPFPIQLAYVGNSPNSAALANALAEAWNNLVDECEDWIQQEEIKASMRMEAEYDLGETRSDPVYK